MCKKETSLETSTVAICLSAFLCRQQSVIAWAFTFVNFVPFIQETLNVTLFISDGRISTAAGNYSLRDCTLTLNVIFASDECNVELDIRKKKKTRQRLSDLCKVVWTFGLFFPRVSFQCTVVLRLISGQLVVHANLALTCLTELSLGKNLIIPTWNSSMAWKLRIGIERSLSGSKVIMAGKQSTLSCWPCPPLYVNHYGLSCSALSDTRGTLISVRRWRRRFYFTCSWSTPVFFLFFCFFFLSLSSGNFRSAHAVNIPL